VEAHVVTVLFDEFGGELFTFLHADVVDEIREFIRVDPTRGVDVD